ncbi:cadmium resistance transporter [Leptolyngbya sp. FACHB-321]|uniref:cadmium resistance transporter n=1 Tax=Leptolyngbya sp. FACHB-321 TaxID=2692807 RepID=UPI001689C84A|nr:cadmium resistance transporter [Leptolyngbya sp. FACHB-321]MBD2034323.1 cadmium resistance transporter [Leptolyngbya sp. FACHB-321]
MNELLAAITTGLTAFTATNLDDILILLLFFSQVNTVFRRRHVVAGQYLGFAALVVVSLPGFFSGLLLPRPWIGMLGIVPIAIGISRLLQTESEAAETETPPSATPSTWLTMLSPQAYSVAAVTFANGGDNIGIYMPLFANSPWESLIVILSVFFGLVGVWCGAAYQLMKVPAIAEMLTRYGNQLVPYVLIGLGVLILLDSHTLENRGLVVLTLLISGTFTLNLLRKLEQVSVAKLYSTSKAVSKMEKN